MVSGDDNVVKKEKERRVLRCNEHVEMQARFCTWKWRKREREREQSVCMYAILHVEQ